MTDKIRLTFELCNETKEFKEGDFQFATSQAKFADGFWRMS
jgi:hypothetical protein